MLADILASLNGLAFVVPIVVLVVAGTVGVFVYALQKPVGAQGGPGGKTAAGKPIKIKSKAPLTKEEKLARKKAAAAVAKPAKVEKKEKKEKPAPKVVAAVAVAPAPVAPIAPVVTKKAAKDAKKKQPQQVIEVVQEEVVVPVVATVSKAASKKAAVKTAPAVAPVAVAAAPAAPVAAAKAKKATKVAAAAAATVAAPSKAKSAKKGSEKSQEDFDDGSWLTVPTKGDKKKTKDDGSATATKSSSASTTPEKTSKQLKDQSNKAKKEAASASTENNSTAKQSTAAAAAVVSAEPIAAKKADSPVPTRIVADKTQFITVDLASLPAVAAQFGNHGPSTGFEYLLPALSDDRKQADIISKIEEAISDVVVKPLPPIYQRPFKQFEAASTVPEKADEPKLIENNGVAFDELADAWTEAKAPKRVAASKKKVRKD